jgi:hypothetical protein
MVEGQHGMDPGKLHEHSRRRSRAVEFGALVLVTGAAAGLAFDAVRSALSKPLSMVAAAL